MTRWPAPGAVRVGEDGDVDSNACPLCRGHRVRSFARVGDRRYRECPACGLVFLALGQRLSGAAERAHYVTHENDAGDVRYRAFLDRLARPLVARLPPGVCGLDYGSGPGPTLSVMLEELGFPMEVYDPFFAPDQGALDRSYDFITCTETAEHFFQPGLEFDTLDRLLKPGGWLAVMTEIFTGERPLEQWRYARDPTHVCFYRARTAEWIATRYGWRSEWPHPNVVLFRKG